MIVIEPSGRRGPGAIVAHSRLGGHVRKRAIPVVVQQNRMAVPRHIDVRKSVVVIVRNRHPEEEGAIGVNFALRCHVGERSVAIIAVQRRLRSRIGMKKRGQTAIHEECVEVTIIVVIDPGHARPHRF